MSFFDINEDLPSDYGDRKYINLEIKEGVEIRFPNKSAAIDVLVMPSFGDKARTPEAEFPTSWQPYRDQEGKFTQWAAQFKSYTLIGGRLNLFDVSILDPNAPNPVKALLEVAKADPNFYHLMNLGPNGKKLEGNQPPPALSYSTVKYAINAVEINPRKEEDRGLSRVMIINRTAIRPPQRIKKDAPANVGSWGLIAALELRNRNTEGVNPLDFPAYYYWGDITNPNALTVCRVNKSAPPSGGMPIYNMTPSDGPQVPGTLEMLQSRTYLADIFAEPSAKETIEALVEIFGNDHPTLVTRAFERSYPGVANLLQQSGIVSHSTVHQPGAVPAASALPAPAQAAQSRSFLPAAAAPVAQPAAVPAQPTQQFVPASAPAQAAAAPAVATAIPAATTQQFTPAAATQVAAPIPQEVPVPLVSVVPTSTERTAADIKADLMGLNG